MAEPIAALIVDIQANTSQLVTSVDTTNTKLDSLGTSAIKTNTSIGTLEGGLRTADKTLNVMGINIGPQIQAIHELGQAAGKTATEIGLIGTAGLAVGAGLAGWQVGRMVAGFFDLDEKIGASAAKLMGWGDVAAETAGAKADMLARASENAGRQITDLSEAVRINTEAAGKMAKSHEDAAKAMKEAADEAAKWQAAIDAISGQLVGSDDIARARDYLEALSTLESGGLKPLRSEWETIVKVMRESMAAMEEWGLKGTAEFRKMAAAANEFAGLTAQGLLPSRAIGRGLSQAPDVGTGSGNVSRVHEMIAAETELAAWHARQKADIAEIDALVQQHIESQKTLTTTAAEGAEKATTKYHEWARAVGILSDSFKVAIPLGTDLAASYRFVTGHPGGGMDVKDQARFGVPNRSLGPGQTVIHIDASNGFYDTPDAIQRLADKVGNAVISRVGR